MTSPPDLRSLAQQWLTQGKPAMLVQVIASQGSVPREAGSKMLVSADAVAGTIGGGQLEFQAIAAARTQLSTGPSGPSVPVVRHLALGPTLGQCCGGALDLRTERLNANALATWPEAPLLFTLQLYGAGHVGRAIIQLLQTLACRVQWIDEREAEFPAGASAPHIERLCVESVQTEVRDAPPGAYYLVLTHSHALDLAITEAVLRRGDFGYLGLIGSATKRAKFLRRFEQRGIADEVVARLTCPIGVPGIAGKQPEVIALAVVAQLLQQASQTP